MVVDDVVDGIVRPGRDRFCGEHGSKMAGQRLTGSISSDSPGRFLIPAPPLLAASQ